MIDNRENEHYLNNEQLEYFRGRLLKWKLDLIKEIEEVRETLAENDSSPDIIDSACNIATQAYDLRTKDRARKLVHKIEGALERIEGGTYGYCEETGRPIGLNRLEARPVATLCIEAQETREKNEKIYKKGALDGQE
jgi:DnaK suppressor protein